jgi:hypothetical protein
VFKDNVENSHRNVKSAYPDLVDVPPERRFVGFDGYKKAMDTLKKGDVVILTTPPAFRWVQFTYAIEKGLNVFMEKPITVDGPSSRRMFKLGEEASKKGLKVGVGLMCRHCKYRKELFERVKGGEIGDLVLLRAYRNAGPTASAFVRKKPEKESELLYQVKNFHSFLWLSGGAVSDFLIHNVDEACWMKDAWPVEAKASGGRHYRGDYVDQNFDTYSTEYTFADGSKFFLSGRLIAGCDNEFATYIHGAKGAAVVSHSGHAPAYAATYKGQKMTKENLIWAAPRSQPSPYELEWANLMDAIRSNRPYNEVERGVKASLVTVMGRMAAHTGRKITYEQMLNHEHELGGPDLDKLTLDGPSPLPADKDGKYPIPQPGKTVKREY